MNQIVAPTALLDAEPLSSPVASAVSVATGAKARATGLDQDDAFPADDVRALAESGLLRASLPLEMGGQALGSAPGRTADLARVLMIIGGGSLPLGRLYEGHVNALLLIGRYGRPEQVAHFATLAAQGELFAVWNTEVDDGVRLHAHEDGLRLTGRKVFASGAGHVVHPLITARTDADDLLMVIPTVRESARADLSGWRPHGMRASASGAVDFAGLPIERKQIIGGPDDFHRQPVFSAGAWRFAAVQTGGIAAVFDAARHHLVAIGRAADPHQRARMGAAAVAVQSARQWVLEAAAIADDETIAATARIAHVNLARSAVERAGLDVLELAQRSVGLAGFQRTHSLERLSRDLATYLRQPNPDKAIGDAATFVLDSTAPALDLWPWP